MTVTVCWTGKLDGNDWNLIWNKKVVLKICRGVFFSGLKKKTKSQFGKIRSCFLESFHYQKNQEPFEPGQNLCLEKRKKGMSLVEVSLPSLESLGSNNHLRIMWVFPKIMVPPKSSIFNRDFQYKPSILGYPYFRKHPCH